jgi:calcineurin-like phosphoesterase family protein
MNDVFFTSDLHDSHNNILKFTERNKVTTPEAHTEWLVNMWNLQVQPGDTVYHLGDLSFARKYGPVAELVAQLNGQIHLIHGNHCNPQFMKQLVLEHYATWYGDYKEIKPNKQKICLFHYPIAAWNGQHHGSWHLHGHCHGSFIDNKGKTLDVGIDNVYKVFGEHRLLSYQDVADYMSAQPIYTPDHHTPRNTHE